METSVNTCLVTGASRGIGKGIALELCKNGFTVYVTGRNIDTLLAVKEEANAAFHSGTILPIQCDHAVDKEVDKLFRRIARESNGILDLLVNNAFAGEEYAINAAEIPFWDLPPNAWDEVNVVGLRNHYRCAVLASRLMIRRRKGLIINISSMASQAYVLTPFYSVGKCALDRIAKDCAYDLEKYGVCILSLWPCAVKTEYFLKHLESPDSKIHQSKEAVYFFRNGESPGFIGAVVVNLLKDPHVLKKSGKAMFASDLAKEYGITDEGRIPADFRSIKDSFAAAGFGFLSKFIPSFLKFPYWMLQMILGFAKPLKNESLYSSSSQ